MLFYFTYYGSLLLSSVCFDNTRRKIIRWGTLYNYQLALKFGYQCWKHNFYYHTCDVTVVGSEVLRVFRGNEKILKPKFPSLRRFVAGAL